ncbi:hypothetical protein [Bradyrhizobium ganzhouense]|uniref:hypothetical protein n=1 Tax=Bradyrhizobium ganzhouense TaxID=1179767 RepID=UPI003CF33770
MLIDLIGYSVARATLPFLRSAGSMSSPSAHRRSHCGGELSGVGDVKSKGAGRTNYLVKSIRSDYGLGVNVVGWAR